MTRRKLGLRATLSLLNVLMLSSLASLTLLLVRVAASGGWRYWFLAWNLFLAWLPLAFAAGLRLWLNDNRWLSWQGLLLTALWLGFLPNSFYIVSDFIHLYPSGEVSLLFDSVLFQSFALNGLILGYLSLYMVHGELNRRKGALKGGLLVVLVLILCSFAIYLGRYLRWNTWDVALRSVALIWDIGNRLMQPASQRGMASTTLLFSFFLVTSYFAGYRVIQILRAEKV